MCQAPWSAALWSYVCGCLACCGLPAGNVCTSMPVCLRLSVPAGDRVWWANPMCTYDVCPLANNVDVGPCAVPTCRTTPIHVLANAVTACLDRYCSCCRCCARDHIVVEAPDARRRRRRRLQRQQREKIAQNEAVARSKTPGLAVKRAKVTASRVIKLSAPDAKLLMCGFLSLLAAAVCTSMIPHFTGSVVDKVAGVTRVGVCLCGYPCVFVCLFLVHWSC